MLPVNPSMRISEKYPQTSSGTMITPARRAGAPRNEKAIAASTHAVKARGIAKTIRPNLME